MKRKFLLVALVVLLLCAVVIIPGSAARTQIRGNVHYFISDGKLGPKCGSIVINLETGEYTASVTGTDWLSYQFNIYEVTRSLTGENKLFSSPPMTDSTGSWSGSGTITAGARTAIQSQLQSKQGVVFVFGSNV